MHIFRSWLETSQKSQYDLESQIIGRSTIDIGCGQGDMIAGFASVLEKHGNPLTHAIGVDPASLEYGEPQESMFPHILNEAKGRPMTLGEAQAKLKSSSFGSHISFRQCTAPDLVSSQPSGTYSVAYFAHSLYYLPSVETVRNTLRSLRESGLQTLLLAEWALECPRFEAIPHLLATLAQSIKPLPSGNVQTVLSPKQYVDVARSAGWEVVGQGIFNPIDGLEDGKWEANIVMRAVQREEGNQAGVGESAHRQALQIALEKIGMGNVQSMNVWAAVLRPSKTGVAS